MNTERIKVACVIPAYNEALVIGDVVLGLQREFSKTNHDYDIIVIDDGSKDDTALVAAANGAIVIKHILNSGSGSATATGLSFASQNGYDIATTSDADGQHDPTDVIRGIEVMLNDGSDLLIGSRLMDSRGMSRVKILGNKGLSFLTRVLFGVNVTDSQSGLRIFSNYTLKQLRWKTSGYEFCSEMLWRAKQQGLVIREYPIKAIYTDYSKGKGQNNWNAFFIIKTLIRQRIIEVINE